MFILKTIISWRLETKVLRDPGQIFPNLGEDGVSVVAAAAALHGRAEAPGDEAHQGPAVVGSVMQSVFSTTIGRGQMRLGSHWPRVFAPAILSHKEPSRCIQSPY